MRFIIDVSVKGDPDPIDVADALLQFLFDASDAFDVPDVIQSFDGLDPCEPER
jgi:hypothetical protein